MAALFNQMKGVRCLIGCRVLLYDIVVAMCALCSHEYGCCIGMSWGLSWPDSDAAYSYSSDKPSNCTAARSGCCVRHYCPVATSSLLHTYHERKQLFPIQWCTHKILTFQGHRDRNRQGARARGKACSLKGQGNG